MQKIKTFLIIALAMPAFAANAAGDATAGAEQAKGACAACHGADGNSAAPNFPSLAGQVPGYVSTQLARFKSKERENAVMAGIAAPLSEEEMANLDAYFSTQKMKPGAVPESDKEMAERGGRIYRGGYEPLDIAACMSCHGPSGHGVPRNFPRVAGQSREYLEQQLLAFKSGARVSSGNGNIMNSIAFLLSEQQIKELAAYMHALQ